MARIVCISDTHGLYRNVKLPDGDILVHAGDWTNEDDYFTVRDFLTWMEEQPHPYKIIVPGNHQTWVEANLPHFIELCAAVAPSVIYLNDSGVTIDGLKVWGSGYTPEFCDYAFNVQRGPHIQRHWDMIPSDTEFLITHGPPLGTLDVTRYGARAGGHYGCGNLAMTIRERLKSLKAHVFGHFHGPHGQVETKDGVTYINASVVDESYTLKSEPIIVNV